MIVAYWLIVGFITFFGGLLILTYCGFILKDTKIHNFVRSDIFITIFKKVLLALLTLFLIITFIFLITEFMPKNYHSSLNPDYASSDRSNNLISKLFSYYHSVFPIPKKVCSASYLDDTKIVCSNYKYKLIDLKHSFVYMINSPVETIIKDRTTISFCFGILAYFLQCIIGYPLGLYIAKKENKLTDKIICVSHSIISIIPAVIYFFLFIIVFMVFLKLPVMFEIVNPLTYIAPLTAVTVSGSISLAYYIRKYVLIELNKDYAKFAKSKGLSENTILYKHVLRNAMVPFVRTIPTSLIACLCGFYLLESAFNIPGIGLTLISAVKLQDVYLIRGILLYFSILYISAYLIGDLVALIYNKKSNLYKGGIRND